MLMKLTFPECVTFHLTIALFVTLKKSAKNLMLQESLLKSAKIARNLQNYGSN
jgi:hypothetical protein